MIRRLLSVLVVFLVGAALLVAGWPELVGAQRLPGAAHVVSFRILAAAVALVLLLVVLCIGWAAKRARALTSAMAILLVLFIGGSSAVMVARGYRTEPLPPSSDLTVLTWNTLGPATTAADIADLADEVAADIVVLPETTSKTAVDAAVLLKGRGRPMWVHTLAYDQISPARSTSLLTSVDLGGYSYDSLTPTTAVLPTVVARPTDGSGPTIVAVHAVAPMPGQLGVWPRDLRLLADFCSEPNVIMAGDFNATLDHMAGLGSARGAALGECQDAALARSAAGLGTWPTSLPAFLGAPIDHVMATSDWTVTGAQVIESRDRSGSDHRPIAATLSRD